MESAIRRALKGRLWRPRHSGSRFEIRTGTAYAFVFGLSLLMTYAAAYWPGPKQLFVLVPATGLAIAAFYLGLRNVGALFSCLIVALILAPTIPVGAIPVSPIDAIAIGTLASLPMSRQRGWPVVGIASVCWLGAMVISLAPHLLAREHFALENLLRVFRMAEVLLPIWLLGRARFQFTPLNYVILVSGTLSLLVGLAGFSGRLHSSLFGPYVGVPTEDIYLSGQVIHRATGVYRDPAMLGDMAAVVILTAWLTLIRLRSTAAVLTSVASVGIGALALLAAYSRSSIIFLLTGVALTISSQQRRLQLLLAFAGTGVFVAVLLLVFEHQFLVAFINQRLGIGGSGSSDPTTLRLTRWPVMVQNFLSSPSHWLFGVGYKSVFWGDPNNFLARGIPGDHQFIAVNNNYLSALFETGFVGLAAMLFWLVAMGRHLLASQPGVSRILALALLVGLVVESLTYDALTYYRLVGILVVLAATIPAREDEHSQSRRADGLNRPIASIP